MKRISTIACIGECMVELSLGSNAAENCVLGFAGDTFNTAVYLKRAAGSQVEVSYVTAVGQDALSDRMVNLFVEEQLNVDHVIRRIGCPVSTPFPPIRPVSAVSPIGEIRQRQRPCLMLNVRLISNN